MADANPNQDLQQLIDKAQEILQAESHPYTEADGDQSDASDSYGIAAEYTSQSFGNAYVPSQHRDQSKNVDFQAAKALAAKHPNPQARLNAFAQANSQPDRFQVPED